jgi:hypothetical protein
MCESALELVPSHRAKVAATLGCWNTQAVRVVASARARAVVREDLQRFLGVCVRGDIQDFSRGESRVAMNIAVGGVNGLLRESWSALVVPQAHEGCRVNADVLVVACSHVEPLERQRADGGDFSVLEVKVCDRGCKLGNLGEAEGDGLELNVLGHRLLGGG